MSQINPKTQVHEWCRRNKAPIPVYECISTRGMDNKDRFCCVIRVNLKGVSSHLTFHSEIPSKDAEDVVSARSTQTHERKKLAEMDASEQMMKILSTIGRDDEYAPSGVSPQMSKALMTTAKDYFGWIPTRLPVYQILYQNGMIEFPKKQGQFAMFSQLLFNTTISSQLFKLGKDGRRYTPYSKLLMIAY
jgi:hypothetical protein